MPRAASVCLVDGCTDVTQVDGRCRRHYVPRPAWANTSPRNRDRAKGETTLVRRVLARDRGVCWICGRAGADEVDHVVPISRGGSNHPSNLAAVHADPCHADKTCRESRP